MKLPALLDYQQALQVPKLSFVDPGLSGGQPRLNPLGMPAVASGGFALTFELTAGGRRYAVRCFHKQSNRLAERYAKISDFVSDPNLDFLVDVDYIEQGIRVNGLVYPVVRMPWVGGLPLHVWIDDNLHRPAEIDAVRQQISAKVTQIGSRKVAHGDLQHGNILIDAGGDVRFIDYDGMYLPSLAGLGAAEAGHRNYQHPDRGDRYDESLDVFAASVLELSLATLIHAPDLWSEFHTGENLILSATDFADPAASSVFARLQTIPQVAEQAQRLAAACGVAYETAPQVLSGAIPAPAISRPQRTAATPSALAAKDRGILLKLQGDLVTVVGRVTQARTLSDRPQTTFINFGDYRKGTFTVVAWSRASQGLATRLGDVRRLAGQWVAITGMISLYQSRTGALTPQIVLDQAASLRPVSESQASSMLQTSPAPKATPTSPPSRQPSNDLDSRLSRLYSSGGLGGTSFRTSKPPPPEHFPPGSPAAKPPPQRPTTPKPPASMPMYMPAPPHVPPPAPIIYSPPPVSSIPSAPYVMHSGGSGARPPDRGLGIAALVFSWAGIFGLIFAVVAMVRWRRISQADRVCAVIGAALSLISIALCCGLKGG